MSATLAVALVGAVTGVAALVTQVWGLVLSGPRVRVANALVPTDMKWRLSVEASNVGRLPVTLVDVGVAYTAPSGEQMRVPLAGFRPGLWVGPPPPHRLPDGEAGSWLFDAAALAETIAKGGAQEVRGYVRLATGKTVHSRRRNTVDVVHLAGLE